METRPFLLGIGRLLAARVRVRLALFFRGNAFSNSGIEPCPQAKPWPGGFERATVWQQAFQQATPR